MSRKSSKFSPEGFAFGFCLFQAMLAFIYVIIGTMSFNYVLMIGFGKDVPWYLDLLGGIVTGMVVVPMAIIGYILQVAGVPMPLIG